MRRFLVISFFTCLLIGLWSVGLRQGYLNHFSLPDPILSFFRHFGLTGPPSPAAAPPVQTSPQEIFTKINLYRQNQALAVLSADPALCSALNLTADQPLTDAVLAICPQCTRAALPPP